MPDPKVQIEKITRQVKNPQNAAFLEQIEANDHLSEIKENLKPVAKISSFVQHFLDEVTPKRGVDYLPEEEMSEIKKELTPVYKKDYLTEDEISKIKEDIKPRKGEDYWTEEEVSQVIDHILQKATPVKGEHYFDGEPGTDGKNADEEAIVKSVMSKIKLPKDGKDGKAPKIEEIIKATLTHLTGLKGDQRPSLRMFKESEDLMGTVQLHKNMMSRMPKSLIDGDQRWGGHGGSNGTQVVGEVVSGSVQTFTLANTPNTGTLAVYGGGQRLFLTTDYTLSGKVITTVGTWNSGDLLADYSYT